MALDSIGSDSNLKLNTIKPVTGIDNPVNLNAGTIEKTGNVALEKDGANVNSNKGKIPASGSLFGSSESSPAASNAENVIKQYSSDKKQLLSFSKALDNLDLSNGIEGISDDTLNELLTLGFDISMDHGKVVIKDNDGNSVSVEDFMKLKDNLSNTLKRSIASVDNVAGAAKSSGVKPTGTTQATTEIKAHDQMPEIQQQEMLNILKGYSDTTHHIQEVSNPMKTKLESAIKEYDSIVSQADKQSQKIDMSISQILALRKQAESLVDKSKSQPLSSVEKKQLQSLASTIQLKQKELVSNQQGNEILMNQIDQVYSQFSNDLSPSEKETKDAMQIALKSKISGQALTVRQNFLASISEDIFKLTSNMSDEELQKAMSDTPTRVKMLAPVNKLLDKISGAKTKADLSQQDIDNLWTKFKIKAVDENGQLELYYYADEKSKPQKVSKDDLRSLKTDLNNVVSSPQLFTLARASGQISIAYDKGLFTPPPKDESSGTIAGTVAQESSSSKASEQAEENNAKKETNPKSINIEDDITQKNSEQILRSALDKSIDARREEEKYHEKQIGRIHETRREVNKHLENKHAQEVETKKQDEIARKLHN